MPPSRRLGQGDAGRGFAVVADEVRSLAQRTNTFSEEIGSVLSEIRSSIDEVGDAVSQAAATDLSVAHQSQENVGQMWGEMEALNDRATEQSRHITLISEKIHNLVMDGIMSLQFEDIVRQLIDKTSDRTQHMEAFLQQFIEVHMDRGDQNGLVRIDGRNAQLRNLLEHADSAFSSIRDDSIAQQSVDEGGEVELF